MTGFSTVLTLVMRGFALVHLGLSDQLSVCCGCSVSPC